MAIQPITGFLPDADPTLAGVITACDGYIPTTKGMRSAFEPVSVGYGALGSACLGATIAYLVDGSRRVFSGTADALYEVQSDAWVDVSRATAYTTGSGRWRYAQVGNVTLAVNYYDLPQSSNLSGAFDDVADMPKAKFICTTKNTSGEFVMLAHTDDNGLGIAGGPNAEAPNYVWWSGVGNYTTWAPSQATQAGFFPLVDTPGPITGLKALGENVVVYKQRAIYLGAYGGSTILWGFRNISDDIGAMSNECIVSSGNAHFFIGIDSIYRFDGNQPVDIGHGIKEWFYSDLDSTNANKIVSLYDRYRSLVYWFYPAQGSGGVVDHWIAYHVPSGRWGAGTNTVEAALESISASETYDDLWSGITFDEIPAVNFDSNYFSDGMLFPCVFTSDHVMSSLSGASGTNTLTFGYMGDDAGFSHLRRFTPRWQQVPTSATCVHTYGNTLGDTMTSKTAVAMSNGRFDLRQSARWHQLAMTTVGTCEFSGFMPDLVATGRE